jgi:hypothetical protein
MVGCRVQNSCLMHLPTIMQNRERYVLKLCRPFAILLNHNEYDRNFWEKTIKFIFHFSSDWGAQQISLDFSSLRHWIGKNPSLKEDSRRYLLLLDSIRQCEGVAKLLQSKPGEVLDIRPAKNKVAPITGEFCF